MKLHIRVARNPSRPARRRDQIARHTLVSIGALAGEAVALTQIDERIRRVCFHNSMLCFVNTRFDTPTVGPEPPD
jgi:hypothetical protein